MIAFNAELRTTASGATYPSDDAAVPPTGLTCTRLLIHTARRLLMVEKAENAVPAGLKVEEDPFKPLPEALRRGRAVGRVECRGQDHGRLRSGG